VDVGEAKVKLARETTTPTMGFVPESRVTRTVSDEHVELEPL
jgi:hypothetical protein